jgi:hypothetical protein
MIRVHRVFIIMFVITWFAAGNAGAAGNIRIGQMEIRPYLSLKEVFSDNIYFTSTEQKNDSITVTTPGVKILWPFGVHRLEAEYYAVDSRYGTYRGENTTDEHARGLLGLQFGSYFSLTAGGAFDKGHEPRGSSATGFIEIFRTNAASVTAAYQLATRSRVQLDYSKTVWNFMDNNFRDRDEGLLAGYVYYRFLPKTSAFIEYEHKAVDFTEATTPLDNAMGSLLLGLTWEMDGRSKGTVKFGRTSKDFEDPTVKDFSVWTWSVDLNHTFSELTSLTLVGGKYVNETNRYGTAYYITTGLYGEITHKFMSKMALLLRGSYGTDRFSNVVPPETVVREDKAKMVGIGLRYTMKDWLEFGADYNKKNRDSNISGNDYQETHYVLSANMVF